MPVIRRTVQGEPVRLNVLPERAQADRLNRWVDHVIENEDGIVGLDVETTALDEILGSFEPTGTMRMIQFGSFREAWALDPHDEFWRELILDVLCNEELRFVTHTNYDTIWTLP